MILFEIYKHGILQYKTEDENHAQEMELKGFTVIRDGYYREKIRELNYFTNEQKGKEREV